MRRCTQATLAGPVLCVLGIAAISLATACKGTTRDAVRRIDRGARVFRPAPPTRPFFRAAYGYGGTRLTPAREGARYTVMILQQTDRRIVPRLKARNRNLKVLMYVDMMASDTRDPAGVLSWSGHADAGAKHSDWFLRDANGASLVVDDYPRSRVMDVGNRHYQDAGVARVIRMAKAGHFDGVLLDDANASLDWVITGGSVACVKYPTRAAWQSAVYSFLSNVGPKLRRAGLLAVANIGGSTITPGLWQKWSGPLDGAMEESFTNGGARPDSLENGEWPEKLSHALWSESSGKISLDHAVTETRADARYGLATCSWRAGRTCSWHRQGCTTTRHGGQSTQPRTRWDGRGAAIASCPTGCTGATSKTASCWLIRASCPRPSLASREPIQDPGCAT